MAVPLKNDLLGKMNVFALLIGEKGNNKDTIILNAHTDTLSEEIREDLLSGKYLFGRGTSDMKGGGAVHITVLEKLSEHSEKLSGNILLSLNPVEEALHTGIIEALDTIDSLRIILYKSRMQGCVYHLVVAKFGGKTKSVRIEI